MHLTNVQQCENLFEGVTFFGGYFKKEESLQKIFRPIVAYNKVHFYDTLESGINVAPGKLDKKNKHSRIYTLYLYN